MNATIYDIHSFFPTNKDDSEDPILEKKMIKKDGQWRIEKDVLGWTFEERNKTMVLEGETIKIILSVLKDWTRAKKGTPFTNFQNNACKVQHASKGVPAVKVLFAPINQLLDIQPEPKLIFVRPNSKLQIAINGFRVLLQDAHKEPTE